METNLKSRSGLDMEVYMDTDIWLEVCHSSQGWARGSRPEIGLAAPYRRQEIFHPCVFTHSTFVEIR